MDTGPMWEPLPPPGYGRRLSGLELPGYGVAPTVEDFFRKIQIALTSLEGDQTGPVFVSNVHVKYNDMLGYPERILIVYDDTNSIGEQDNVEPRPYNEYTYLAEVSDMQTITEGPPNIAPLSAYPSSQLDNPQELLTNARTVWAAREVTRYEYKYILFYDVSMIGVDRKKAPHPWDILVVDRVVETVTDANGGLLYDLSVLDSGDRDTLGSNPPMEGGGNQTNGTGSPAEDNGVDSNSSESAPATSIGPSAPSTNSSSDEFTTAPPSGADETDEIVRSFSWDIC